MASPPMPSLPHFYRKIVMKPIQPLLTKEYLARLETLSLKMANKASVGFTGARKSSGKGQSLEFADFRDYTPGDDLRRIDWNSYGRLDKLFLKLFTEEKQAEVNVFIDASTSMDDGEPNKLTTAKLLGATLAYLAVKNGDRVNVYTCGDGRILARKTGLAGKNQFPELVRFLDGQQPQGQTRLNQSIEELKHNPMGAGISFIISDFFSMDGYEESVKMLQNKRQQVCLFHILDKTELNPELSGALQLTDAETQETLDVYITGDVLTMYAEALKQFQNAMKGFCEARNAAYATVPTDCNIIKLLTAVIG